MLGRLERCQRLDFATLGAETKPDFMVLDHPWLYGLVAALACDGLVTVPASASCDAPIGIPQPRPPVRGEQAAVRETGVLYRFDVASELPSNDVKSPGVVVSLREE